MPVSTGGRAALLSLLVGGCVPAPAPEVFPAHLRGTWAESPAACDSAPVRITATTMSAHGSLCRIESAAPAAGGGLLARLSCTRTEGDATGELARFTRIGDELAMQVGDARLDWTRCGWTPGGS